MSTLDDTLIDELRVASLVARLRRQTYSKAHHAVADQRGPAAALPCVGCGVVGLSQWSYDHNDPNGRWLWHASHKRYCRCGAPEFYSPRCQECHSAWDRSHA